jgi:N-acylneuraminate cytidylyltransferase
MAMPVHQGIKAKGKALNALLSERGIAGENVIYVGNDVNDLPCFPLVGCAVAVADAHPEVLRQATLVLRSPGGYGAVREICDLVIDHYCDDYRNKEN